MLVWTKWKNFEENKIESVQRIRTKILYKFIGKVKIESNRGYKVLYKVFDEQTGFFNASLSPGWLTQGLHTIDFNEPTTVCFCVADITDGELLIENLDMDLFDITIHYSLPKNIQ